jgi:HEAT repeat protein
MNITEVLNNKTKKAKEKVETISKWLLEGSLPVCDLIAIAEKSKDPEKATCIEAIEFATRQAPQIAGESTFNFVTKALTENAPRIKWESAKVVGNIAHRFPSKLNKAIRNLLANTEHEGTVVRWAAAFALGEILKLKTRHYKELLPAIEAICNSEPDKGVKKKYLDAMKKANGKTS